MGDLTGLWAGRHATAIALRAALGPFAAGYGMTVRLHAAAARIRWGSGIRLPAPAVTVGNLVVGGTGKTPIASWIARWCHGQGLRPGILLRGYGGDEADIHRRTVPGAVVVEDARRVRGARRAVDRGAEVLILDDALQRRELRPDLTMALLGSEWSGTSRFLLPAGPWREPLAALRRADLIVVTIRPPEEPWRLEYALRLTRDAGRPVAVAALRIAGLERLRSGDPVPLTAIRGRRVLAVAGVAHPRAFARQLASAGAGTSLLARRDHAPFRHRDVARLARAARAEVDYVVLTAKDAAKLRSLWPTGAPEPLVANLAVHWSQGYGLVEAALHRVVESAGRARTSRLPGSAPAAAPML